MSRLLEEEVNIFIENEDDLVNSLSSLEVSDHDDDAFVRIEKHDHLLFKHVFNVENCNENIKILNKIPLTPPNDQGTYFCLVDGNTVPLILTAYCDRLNPWSSSKKKPHYNDCCLIQSNNGWKFHKSLKDDAHYFGNVYTAIHPNPNFDVKKWVYSATFKKEKTPAKDSKIVIVYEVKKSFEMPPMPVNLRLQENISAELRPLLKTGSAKQALNKFNENGNVMKNDITRLITYSQVQRLGNRMSDRQTGFNQGRPIEENETKFQKLVSDANFVKDSAKGDGYERYFCSTDSALALFEHELFPVDILKNRVKQIEILDSNTSNTRYEKFAEFINTEQYKNDAKCGILMADETYNLGRLVLTVVNYISRNFLSKNGPAPFTVAYMLSKGKSKDDFKWMAHCLAKRIQSNGKVVIAYGSDGALALDGIEDAPFITDETGRSLCMIHARKLFAAKCPNDMSAMFDIFGFIDESGIKHPGIFDLPYDAFLLKVSELAKTDAWLKNPELITWTTKKHRMDFYYTRCCLKTRVLAGYGFDESDTNSLEGENFQLKTVINDNTPLHILALQLQQKQINQIENFGMAIYQKIPISLRDDSKFLGTINFALLTNELKRSKLKKMGIKYTDQLPSFAEFSNTFPQEFAPKTTEKDRFQLMDEAATYGVTPHPTNKNGFIVVKDPEYIGVRVDEKVECSCKVIKTGALICVHILAVHQKHPELKIFDIIKNYKDNETQDEKIKREYQKADGAKPGTSRRNSRRNGPNSTRNKRREPTEKIIDLSYPTHAGPSANYLSSPSSSTSTTTRKRQNSENTHFSYNSSTAETASSKFSNSTASSGVSSTVSKRRAIEVINLGDEEEIMIMHTPQINAFASSDSSFKTAFTTSRSQNRTPLAVHQPSFAPRILMPTNINSIHPPFDIPRTHNMTPRGPSRRLPQPLEIISHELPSTSSRLPRVPHVQRVQTVEKPPIQHEDYLKDDENTKNAFLQVNYIL
uniref:SWIM-type domain-containing protein n=1 Tax=Panagrolaimus superbus TaxID=310955 RepID=A0A914YVV1_9BILA